MEKTIYKLDSKGKVRVLTISAKDGHLSQVSGVLGGKLVEHTSLCTPKNVGKVNETTPEQQAIAEAFAKLKKKLEEGYFETVEEARKEEVILPMLAKSFGPEADKIDWKNAFVQPKLDGMRCLKKNTTMISRTGKVVDTLPHIKKLIPEIADYLDGELYAHGLSFQENMRLIKKNRPASIGVKYHVYDMVLPLPFQDRMRILISIIEATRSEHIELVPTFKVESIEEVQEYHAQFIGEGYEGTMIRWGDEEYKVNGRSSNLLKYKDFLDITAPVIFVKPSERNPEQGVVVCELPGFPDDKGVFGCGMKFSHEEREEILTNREKYMGMTAEIRFFEYTDEGLPRFPVCVGFRLDK
jgi:DNA ligase-1